VAYNYWIREVVELKDGEGICPVCHGYGVGELTGILNEEHRCVCLKCLGHGKIDWIEKAVGKKDLAVGVIEF